MKDRFGHDRGACKSCNNCEEFIAQEFDVKCGNCGCKPVSHEKGTPLAWGDGDEDCSIVSDCSLTNVQEHRTSYDHVMDYSSTSSSFMGSRCGFHGCNNEVEFDVNTGLEYCYCSLHIGGDGGSVHDDVIIIEDMEDLQEGTVR